MDTNQQKQTTTDQQQTTNLQSTTNQATNQVTNQTTNQQEQQPDQGKDKWKSVFDFDMSEELKQKKELDAKADQNKAKEIKDKIISGMDKISFGMELETKSDKQQHQQEQQGEQRDRQEQKRSFIQQDLQQEKYTNSTSNNQLSKNKIVIELTVNDCRLSLSKVSEKLKKIVLSGQGGKFGYLVNGSTVVALLVQNGEDLKDIPANKIDETYLNIIKNDKVLQEMIKSYDNYKFDFIINNLSTHYENIINIVKEQVNIRTTRRRDIIGKAVKFTAKESVNLISDNITNNILGKMNNTLNRLNGYDESNRYDFRYGRNPQKQEISSNNSSNISINDIL